MLTKKESLLKFSSSGSGSESVVYKKAGYFGIYYESSFYLTNPTQDLLLGFEILHERPSRYSMVSPNWGILEPGESKLIHLNSGIGEFGKTDKNDDQEFLNSNIILSEMTIDSETKIPYFDICEETGKYLNGNVKSHTFKLEDLLRQGQRYSSKEIKAEINVLKNDSSEESSAEEFNFVWDWPLLTIVILYYYLILVQFEVILSEFI